MKLSDDPRFRTPICPTATREYVASVQMLLQLLESGPRSTWVDEDEVGRVLEDVVLQDWFPVDGGVW